jgi:hypothetical protein
MKAGDSPLRTKMLELYRRGIKVEFVGEAGTNIFSVTMPEGVSIEDHFKILEEIRVAINVSVETQEVQKVDASLARKFVEGIKKLKM